MRRNVEMDIYDFDSYRMSMENLLMLKILHDEGVDVSCFNNYMVHVNYGGSLGEDILFDGLNEIFENFLYLTHADLEQHKEFLYLEEKSSEYFLVIQDSLFEGFNENQRDALLDSFDEGHYDGHVDIEFLPSKDGVVILLEWLTAYGMHELLEGIINLKKEAIRLREEN